MPEREEENNGFYTPIDSIEIWKDGSKPVSRVEEIW